ncbi:hypothetical protein BV25DRAFT_1829476 [Artomyces pyxidatus]|uniref:Uncharacterized protein n=1 Tax=Artomyces pyxidatus TaxID=48021 RepID=A0ACB8ST67_9AGAM|nr:hypothetical protein BV25DRAFT_1829476 [Artomyces pyxidatus]
MAQNNKTGSGSATPHVALPAHIVPGRIVVCRESVHTPARIALRQLEGRPDRIVGTSYPTGRTHNDGKTRPCLVTRTWSDPRRRTFRVSICVMGTFEHILPNELSLFHQFFNIPMYHHSLYGLNDRAIHATPQWTEDSWLVAFPFSPRYDLGVPWKEGGVEAEVDLTELGSLTDTCDSLSSEFQVRMSNRKQRNMMIADINRHSSQAGSSTQKGGPSAGRPRPLKVSTASHPNALASNSAYPNFPVPLSAQGGGIPSSATSSQRQFVFGGRSPVSENPQVMPNYLTVSIDSNSDFPDLPSNNSRAESKPVSLIDLKLYAAHGRPALSRQHHRGQSAIWTLIRSRSFIGRPDILLLQIRSKDNPGLAGWLRNLLASEGRSLRSKPLRVSKRF